MGLDEFDSHVLEQSGDPQQIMRDVYGDEIGKNNAEKQLAGIRKHLKYKQSKAGDSGLPVHKKYRINESGVQVREKLILLSEDDMQDPAIVLRKMGLDPVQWSLITADFIAKSWDVTMKLLEDHKYFPHKETNWGYSCKVRAKPTGSPVTEDLLKGIFENLSVPKHKEYKYKSNGLMLELPLMDLHIGVCDLRTANELARKTVEDFLSRAGSYEKILFPVGQDFFHIDDPKGETTGGTQVETAAEWEEIIQTGFDFLVWAIEELRRLAPVDVFYVPGNHDKMLSYTAVQMLRQVYRDTDSVTVDISKEPRKYRQFGNSMIGFSHGKEEGKRIEKIMQVEERSLWGDTLFNEFHLGHLHHEKVWEDGGIIFRRIPTTTETDNWHNKKAFKGAVRKAQAFEWDKELGLINLMNSVVTMEEI